MGDISVIELKKRLDAGEQLFMIDVREQYEYDISNLGGKLIPLGNLMESLSELSDSADKEIIMICRSGNRSRSAAEFLKQNGFPNARNMVGGMRAWQEQIDPTITVA